MAQKFEKKMTMQSLDSSIIFDSDKLQQVADTEGIKSGHTPKTDICHLLLMDEIFTKSEIEILQKSSHRRSSTKCFRCRHKRIPCSYEFPRCVNCVKAGEDCHAWIKGIKKPIPRSLPLYLENRVAELEIELDSLKQHSVIDNAEEHSYLITKYTGTPFLECFDHSENDKNSIASFNFIYFNASNLPAPFDLMFDTNKKGTMKSFLEKNTPLNLNSIPKNAVKMMMANYMDFHLPQYPIISRPMLTDMLKRVLDDPDNATSFDNAVVSITLAISAALITNRNEKRALSSSSALFSTTMLQILKTSWEFKMRKLQMSLLIAHYGFANPYAADVWLTLRDAFRLCIDMGLHKEVESEVLNVVDADDRRRLFLVCSGMLRHLSSVSKIKFPISQTLISVEYPTIVDDSFISEKGIDYSGPQTKAAALHFYTFRLMESEVCDVLWNNKEISGTLEEWLKMMDEKASAWYLKAEEFAKINQLRYRLISKASLQIRLRRRTPRIPNPTKESFIDLVEAISIHVDEYSNDAKTCQVSYLFVGVYYIVEAAVNLLDIMWFESDWILDSFSLEYLNEKLKGCINLLDKFKERWPDIEASNMPSYLNELREKAVDKLNRVEMDEETKFKISSKIENLVFPYKGKESSITPSLNLNALLEKNNHLLNHSHKQNHSTIFVDEGEILLKDFILTGKSNWNDHFTDGKFWDIEDILSSTANYI